MHVLNGGDGTHAHPTQALLDALTLREAFGSLDGRTVVIVGDVAHSRVARSNLHALRVLGARVRVSGPQRWIEELQRWPGVEVTTTLAEALDGADAVMALRVQRERATGEGISLDEFIRDWRLDESRMSLANPEAFILHPGPTNEGVELTAALANGPQSLIGRQVENGVPVRMAVMALLTGAA